MTATATEDGPTRFVVLLLPGTRLGSAGAAIDTLGGISRSHVGPMFKDRATLSVETLSVSIDGRPVPTAHGRDFAVHLSIDAVASARGVIIADFDADAAGVLLAWQVKAAQDWLRKIHANGGVIAGARGAALFLAETFTNDDGPVAIPVDHHNRFRRQRPFARFNLENSVCEHDRIITADTTAQELEMLSRFIAATTQSLPAVHWFARRTGLPVSSDPQASLSPALSNDQLVTRAQDWLRDRYWHPISVRDVADQFAVSERTLLRRFQRDVKMSPYQFLTNVRIDAAQRLLVRTQLPVAEIGRLAGYPDQRHFRDLFERRTGLSPAKFRKSVIESRPIRSVKRSAANQKGCPDFAGTGKRADTSSL